MLTFVRPTVGPREFCTRVVYCLWWVDLGYLPGAHQQDRKRKSDEKLMDQDEGRDISYQLPSQAKQMQFGEINLIYCK